MDFFSVVGDRHSIRKFQPTPIPDATVQKILETVNRAPSAGNLQAYEIFVVRDSEKKSRLADICLEQDFVAQAPVVLVFAANPAMSVAEYGARGADLYCILDAGIACAYAQLACTELGLGSCWVGAFDSDRVAEFLGRPDLKPVGVLPIGFPAGAPSLSYRRPSGEGVHEIV